MDNCLFLQPNTHMLFLVGRSPPVWVLLKGKIPPYTSPSESQRVNSGLSSPIGSQGKSDPRSGNQTLLLGTSAFRRMTRPRITEKFLTAKTSELGAWKKKIHVILCEYPAAECPEFQMPEILSEFGWLTSQLLFPAFLQSLAIQISTWYASNKLFFSLN